MQRLAKASRLGHKLLSFLSCPLLCTPNQSTVHLLIHNGIAEQKRQSHLSSDRNDAPIAISKYAYICRSGSSPNAPNMLCYDVSKQAVIAPAKKSVRICSTKPPTLESSTSGFHDLSQDQALDHRLVIDDADSFRQRR